MSNIIDARAQFARRYVLRTPMTIDADQLVAVDGWGPVDLPLPRDALWLPGTLSRDRIMRGGRQVGWRDGAGNRHAFPGYKLRRPKPEHMAALPRTPVDDMGRSRCTPQEREADLAFLRRMTCAA